MELDNVRKQNALLVFHELNSRPRKIYRFKTPNFLFSKYILEKNLHLVDSMYPPEQLHLQITWEKIV